MSDMSDRERRSMLIRPMTGDEINEKVLKVYNFNGMEAHKDLDTIARAESFRANMRGTTPVWLGMSAVSGYNITRMGVLSASGRIGAIGGLAFGTLMTITTLKMWIMQSKK